ncbi:alpha/beta fold hydrolase [Mycolicibacter sinensis]|jgi:pimeloyl-ACP methyl ester carboxylesterase|uniref:Alpha/beta hydrolase n=1 Tax=Mycolicibacter sinensis (strain JDM601) TaxID=875328 RepID=A0A1A2ED00_MYCSD|nr:alpha/beta hydrolase [Mycolicibacter sinensis]OBG02354.1 alpha/beta hydrolase [Mycolicibacter sinensis]OBG05661.1 alpha/beta hydrolase [Mycolicibacter sinensis]
MGKRLAAGIITVVLVALLVNAVVTDRITRAAEPFAGGRVLELPGPDLNIREYGAGGERAIVLLHGYTASIQWWEAVAPALAQGNRVIAVDLVGHGGSEAPRDPAAYSAEAQATAVRQALDALGVRHAVVIGHSMGGWVATALAESAPGLVERVMVSDTPAALGMSALPPLGNAVCWPVLGAALDRFRSVDAIDKSSLQTGFAAGFPIPELAYRSLKRMTHNALCDAKTAGRINEQRAVADRLAGLGKPVLVLWGDRDVLTPTEANVDRYRAAGLDPVVIAGSGHSPMVEKPTEFLDVARDFDKVH